MLPLNHILRKYKSGFRLSKSQEMINHLMWTNNIKLFAEGEKELATLIQAVKISSSSSSSSSSCRAGSTDIPDHLSPLLLIVHRPRQFLPGSCHIDTAIWVYYMDANKTAGEKARRQLHKNAACNLEQVLAAAPHKTPTVRPPASYHENYLS